MRTAEPDQAAEVLGFLQAVAAETTFLLTEPDEFAMSQEDERRWIQTHLEDPGKLALWAEQAGSIIGSLSFENGCRRRNAHQGSFGMAVRAAWRGVGVGTALLECLLEWAKANALIEKVGLAVFSGNLPAIALYQKFGFREEGRQLRQIKLGNHEYQDLILMYRFVKDGAACPGEVGCTA